MNVNDCAEAVIGEIRSCIHAVCPDDLERLVECVAGASRIFCDGVGRSGLPACAFAMRLAHLGKSAYVVSETTTPPIGPGDLLFLCSGSGESESLIVHARKARSLGAQVVLLTANARSTLQELSEVCLLVQADTKLHCGNRSIQPMGTLFEQTLFVLLDIVVLSLMERLCITEKDMHARHKNLE